MSRHSAAPAVALALACYAGCGAPQHGATTAQLVVSCNVPCLVTNRGAPLARASVPVTVELLPGAHQIAASAPGYLTQRFDLLAEPGDVVDLAVVLWPAVPEIDPAAAPTIVDTLLDLDTVP